MKKDIHPKYHQASVSCACGNSFQVGSTMEKISVEICSVCHPFYTGKQKLIDTAGMVDKFKERMQKGKTMKEKSVKAKKAKKSETAKVKKEIKKELKDLKTKKKAIKKEAKSVPAKKKVTAKK